MKAQRTAAALLALTLVFGVGNALPAGAAPTDQSISAPSKTTHIIAGNMGYYVGYSYNADENILYIYPRDTHGAPDTVLTPRPLELEFNKEIKKIVIDDGIRYLPSYAFAGCDSLEEIVIPDSVRCIEHDAFPVGSKVLRHCAENPRFITAGGWIVGYDKEKLSAQPFDEELIFPASVKGFANDALLGLWDDDSIFIDRITVPDSVRSIGANTFAGCYARDIIFPSDDLYIGRDAFKDTRLTSVTIGAGDTLGARAFGDSNIVSVTLAEGFTDIPDEAFQNSKLEDITIPSSVEHIGRDAFYNTPITDSQAESRYVMADNWVLYGHYPEQNGAYRKNALPAGTVGIADYAQLRGEADLPDTLRSIGAFAFYSEENVNPALDIPPSVRRIEANAFFSYHPENITFHEGLEYIGSFSVYCPNTTELVIPSTVRYIGAAGLIFSGENEVSITVLNPQCEIGQADYSLERCGFVVNNVIGYEGSTARQLCEKYHSDRDKSASDNMMIFTSLGSPYPKGDVNHDGEVNVTDLMAVAAHVKAIRPLNDPDIADINGDGDVNVTDLSAIAAHVKGIRALS
ncbi:leucine-rich repeat protein [Ruminococcus sp.]|uniref:leucine-rich repeat protein n=1 Tax=Ruminococcus sp. TaxID=41978 RepID=UPI0025D1198D|nr:leucine-rich repeat protein [Ruminococcus sp.]MBQ8967320.1 leucine-rich repeat protein [Ruminococcus sp.]